jgi:hypothetical protein
MIANIQNLALILDGPWKTWKLFTVIFEVMDNLSTPPGTATTTPSKALVISAAT